MLSKILCMTAMWISCNCCTAPLWLITVICKMSQGSNDSHHPVHPSKVLLKSNYWHPRYCAWHLYGGTSVDPVSLSPDFIVGDKYKCALISFSGPALLFVGFNFCYVSLRNVLSIYLWDSPEIKWRYQQIKCKCTRVSQCLKVPQPCVKAKTHSTQLWSLDHSESPFVAWRLSTHLWLCLFLLWKKCTVPLWLCWLVVGTLNCYKGAGSRFS